MRRADLAGADQVTDFGEARIKAAVKPDLEFDPGFFDRSQSAFYSGNA